MGLRPVTELLVYGWRKAALAYFRRALKERVGPTHPDRHLIEGRIAQLERMT